MTDGASGKIGGASPNDGSGRNRGRFGIRIRRMICDDLAHLNMGRAWRCSFGRIANIATRTCRRTRRRRAFAPTNARSARIASRRNCTMSARTAAAALRRGRSGPRGNGGRGCQWRNGRRRTGGYICRSVTRRSRRIRRGSGIFHRRSGEKRGPQCHPPSLRAERSNPFLGRHRTQMDCFVARAPRNDVRTTPPPRSSPRPHRTPRDNHRLGTSRASQANRRLRGTCA